MKLTLEESLESLHYWTKELFYSRLVDEEAKKDLTWVLHSALDKLDFYVQAVYEWGFYFEENLACVIEHHKDPTYRFYIQCINRHLGEAEYNLKLAGL